MGEVLGSIPNSSSNFFLVLYFGLDNRFLLFVSLPVSNKHYNNSPRPESAILKHSNSGFENTVSCVYIL